MATGDSVRCIRNAPFRAIFPIRNPAFALVTGATNLDTEIIRDTASAVDCASEAVEIGASGIYYIDLSASEMTVSGDASIKTSCTEGWTAFMQLPIEPCVESGVAQSSTASSVTLRSGASATNDLFVGHAIEIVRGTGIGQVRTVTDYDGSTKIVTTDRDWITNPDTSSVYKLDGIGARMGTNAMINVDVQEVDGDADVPTRMQYLYDAGFIMSSVDDATPSATGFDGAAGLSASNDFYNSMILWFTTGTLAGLPREITDYVGSSRTFTVAAFPTSPANGDKFVLLGKVF